MHYGTQRFTLQLTLTVIREGLNICDRDNWSSQKKYFKNTAPFKRFWIYRKYLLIAYFCLVNVSCRMIIQQFTNCSICIIYCLINPLFHAMSQKVLGHFLKEQFCECHLWNQQLRIGSWEALNKVIYWLISRSRGRTYCLQVFNLLCYFVNCLPTSFLLSFFLLYIK